MTGHDMTAGTPGHADSGWDNYAERTLRNEGRLAALESLVAETREADRKLIEQRSESLANELVRRAESLETLVTAKSESLLALAQEERRSDRDRMATQLSESEKRWELGLASLREVHAVAIRQNYEQSREAIGALEQRREAATNKIEQMVRQWRESDREARELFAAETQRHLEQLNHNNERMAKFQAESVTRELWQADKDATVNRENVLRDSISVLDRAMLGMTPQAVSDKAHAELAARFDTTIAGAVNVLDNKIAAVSEKVDELKKYRDLTTGRSAGYSQFWGVGVAAVGVLVSLILLALAVLNR